MKFKFVEIIYNHKKKRVESKCIKSERIKSELIKSEIIKSELIKSKNSKLDRKLCKSDLEIYSTVFLNLPKFVKF